MRTRVYNNKEQIFCEWRHRWVRLTPEEWVRQQLLHRLVEQLGYPSSRIAVEVPLEKMSVVDSLSATKKRCDAVVYDNRMTPLLLIECKAETVPLTQKTLDQAITYNRRLAVPYLVLHNGPKTICVKIEEKITFSNEIPAYNQMTKW